jgi:hypothetical protein
MWEFREKSDFSLRFTGPLNAVYLPLFQCAFSQLVYCYNALTSCASARRHNASFEQTELELYSKNFSHATVDRTES